MKTEKRLHILLMLLCAALLIPGSVSVGEALLFSDGAPPSGGDGTQVLSSSPVYIKAVACQCCEHCPFCYDAQGARLPGECPCADAGCGCGCLWEAAPDACVADGCTCAGTAAARAPEAGDAIVTSYDMLRNAIENTQAETIYLASSAENQGVIEATDIDGIRVGRSITIIGRDPTTGQPVALRDSLSGTWPNQTQVRYGMFRATAANVSITLTDIALASDCRHAMISGETYTGVTLTLQNASFTGRNALKCTGSGAKAQIIDATAQVDELLFTGRNLEVPGRFVLTHSASLSNYPLSFTASDANYLTIPQGGMMIAETNGYLLQDTANRTQARIDGTLRLSARSNSGGMNLTSGTGSLYALQVGGELAIDHAGTQYPTLSARTITVTGRMEVRRGASTSQPVLRLESGGSVTLNQPQLFLLENTGGPVIRSRSGTATITATTQAVNHGIGTDGRPTVVLCRAWLDPFPISWSVNTSGTTTLRSHEIANDGLGDSRKRGSVHFGNGKRFVVGRSTLTLEDVGFSAVMCRGTCPPGGILEIDEYRFEGFNAIPVQPASSVDRSGGSYIGYFDNRIIGSYNRVYAVHYDGLLEAHTCRVIYPPPTSLLAAPELDFGEIDLPRTDTRIGLAAPQNAEVLIGHSAGATGALRVQARANGPLIAEDTAVPLDGELVFISAPGQPAAQLLGSAVSVGSVVPDNVNEMYTITWPQGAGFFLDLRAGAGDGNQGRLYTCSVTWTLIQ